MGLTMKIHFIWNYKEFNMAKQIYFFKNKSSNSTEIIPADDSNIGTVSFFQYTKSLIESFSNYNSPYQYYPIGLVVDGDLKTAEINLEMLMDDGKWVVVDGFNFAASDMIYTKISNSPMSIMKIIDGMFYNLKHRIRIVNPNGDSLSNISIYLLMY